MLLSPGVSRPRRGVSKGRSANILQLREEGSNYISRHQKAFKTPLVFKGKLQSAGN